MRPTILLVDDDASVRRALARLLTVSGYNVESFASALELLQRGHLTDADCILLDILMPGLDGLDAQRALEEADFLNAVVFISGHGDVSSSVLAMKRGAVDFLTKPVDEKQLLKAVEQAVAAGRAKKEQRSELHALRGRLRLLTPREREVCGWVASGVQNKQIAAQLGTTEKTIKVHRARAIAKLRARSLPDLVRIADRLGLRPSPLLSVAQRNS